MGLERAGLLESFHTTLAFQRTDLILRAVPSRLRDRMLRRLFDVPKFKIHTYPMRELVRLAAGAFGLDFLTTHEYGWASVDAVYGSLDRYVAGYLVDKVNAAKLIDQPAISGVYSYEDGAWHTFRVARRLGIRCYYDLPIAYWTKVRELLNEEAVRLPEWEPTLGSTRDSESKLTRKSEELEMADVVICPSQFVLHSLPEEIRRDKRVIVAEFGSPEEGDISEIRPRAGNTALLRILFAGSMTQRKGLADVFAAVRMLQRKDVELVVMGSPVLPLSFYKRQLPNFTYEPPRPHYQVLELMRACDVFVLPSIAEGRALVQQEAMMCGLPVITTANAGGEDLIEEGKTGFLVPIRSPEKIAEKISWFLENRGQIHQMSELARNKAMQVTWDNYTARILEAVRSY